jgi:hypothetical protein
VAGLPARDGCGECRTRPDRPDHGVDVPGASGAAAVAFGAATGLLFAALLLFRSLGRAVRDLGARDALEDFAAAVVAGLAKTGAIRSHLGPDHVRLVVQPDGYYRCYLADATVEESRRFADALDEVLAPLDAPRYIVPRYVDDAPLTARHALAVLARRFVFGRTGERVVYHAVPASLAANRERVDAFARAWNRYVSPGRPLYYQNPRAQSVLEVARGADPFAVTTQMRTFWR